MTSTPSPTPTTTRPPVGAVVSGPTDERRAPGGAYRAPGWITRRLMNPVVAGLTGAGVSVMGSRILRVRGRRSGNWRSTPVNLLDLDGARYLVAPRGETQWVRNLRAAGRGELRVGRRVEEVTATEVTGDARTVVLRVYLRRWAWEVGVFFDGVDAASTDAELAAVADHHPVFVVAPT